jgi:NAD-dependent dihydropyrimidine dehydrogenase PreA subunit
MWNPAVTIELGKGAASMSLRKIVQIDEKLCDGCGQCVTACAEGAIRIIDGKARLVRDEYCDGLGACLGDCPQGAIRIIERDSADFDEEAVRRHLSGMQSGPPARHAVAPARTGSGTPATHGTSDVPHSCPGSRVLTFAARPGERRDPAAAASGGASPLTDAAAAPPVARSELRQWPVQLHLLPPTAPFLRDADLLLAADCAAFSSGDFHARFLQGRALAIACPKLDDPTGYVEKLARMITEGGIRSINVVMMQVPCCRGLEQLARLAMQMAGVDVPLRRIVLGLEGDVLLDE